MPVLGSLDLKPFPTTRPSTATHPFMKRLILCLFLSTLALSGAPEYPSQGPDIYDPKADGSALIAAALDQAKLEHKQVILDFGANWCPWCRRLHGLFEGNPQVAAALKKGYVVVMIDVNTRNGVKRNAQVNLRYGNPVHYGLPVLMVLNAKGETVTTQDSGELEEGQGHSPAKVLAFLDKWADERP